MLPFRCISGFRLIHTLRATGYTLAENKLHQLKIFTINQPAVGVVHHLGSSPALVLGCKRYLKCSPALELGRKRTLPPGNNFKTEVWHKNNKALIKAEDLKGSSDTRRVRSSDLARQSSR